MLSGSVNVKRTLLHFFPSVNWLSRQPGMPTRQAISQWEKIPAQHVLRLERLSGNLLTRHDMRPDLYPRE